MNLKLKRIAPLQAGKMLAALYGLLSLVLIPFLLIAMAVGGFAARHQGGGPALPMMFGLGVGFMIFLPVLYALMGFILGALGALAYNLLGKWIGGFELEFEPTNPPPV